MKKDYDSTRIYRNTKKRVRHRLMTHPHATAPPVALNRCALRLAGHQSPRQDCFSGDEPAGVNTYKWLCGDEPAGVNTYKMVGAGWDRRGAIADFQVHPLLRLSGFEGLHYAEGMSLPGCS